jgi:hypothetical protein
MASPIYKSERSRAWRNMMVAAHMQAAASAYAAACIAGTVEALKEEIVEASTRA